LLARYASEPMLANFSDAKKFRTWRRLWIALAECQQELGLPIRDEQIEELREHAEDIDFAAAERLERQLRHDVMAHVHAYGEKCPKARGIIHWGATSCFVTDNADLIVFRDGLELLRTQLLSLIARMREFALRWKSTPTLGWTHFQPAQATTVGKRACLWLQDLVDDHAELDHAVGELRFRGVKGATGTQASFLELFEGDHDKVRRLDAAVTARMGFERSFGVTGQTYPRKLDFRIAQVLSGLAQSAHKFASDLRLLANFGEIEEPFESNQVGSSAMPWKRNPMRCERICSLARLVIEALGNTAHTAANQWLERTLDDSANRRIVLAEMFLASDAILNLYLNVASGLVVNERVIDTRLREQLPFLVSEHLLMEAVRAGADRQVVHEALRKHSMRAARRMKEEGVSNPMREQLHADESFAALRGRLSELFDPARYVGRAPAQVEEYVASDVDPLLERFSGRAMAKGEVRV
jgi:adenylosuccinate lyase